MVAQSAKNKESQQDLLGGDRRREKEKETTHVKSKRATQAPTTPERAAPSEGARGILCSPAGCAVVDLDGGQPSDAELLAQVLVLGKLHDTDTPIQRPSTVFRRATDRGVEVKRTYAGTEADDEVRTTLTSRKETDSGKAFIFLHEKSAGAKNRAPAKSLANSSASVVPTEPISHHHFASIPAATSSTVSIEHLAVPCINTPERPGASTGERFGNFARRRASFESAVPIRRSAKRGSTLQTPSKTQEHAPPARRTRPPPAAEIGRAPRIGAGSRRTRGRTGRRT